MVTETFSKRHYIASTGRLIIRSLSKGDFGGNIIFTDIASDTWRAQRSLVLPAHVAKRTLPERLLPNLSADELRSCLRPDAIVCLNDGQLKQKMAVIQTYRLYPLRAGMYTSLKSNIVIIVCHDDTRPE